MMNIKGVLLDLEGVLYSRDSPIKGAVYAVRKLSEKYPLRFITNTTRKTKREIIRKLNDMGFDVEQEELFTALEATRLFLEERKCGAFLLLTAAIIVGDDIVANIKGGQNVGLKTALVKTGKFRDRDLKKRIKPDLIIESIKEILNYS